MTKRTTLAASALALCLSVATVAAAHGTGGFMCQTFNMAKTAPATTRCVTWTKDAAERMRAATCDPSQARVAEMHQRCAEMTTAPTTPSNG